MKMIDARCKSCATVRIDTLQRDSGAIAPCVACGADMERIVIAGKAGATANVAPDDIPGGVLIHHGICHEDGTPKRYYSRSAMRKAAEARGLTNYVVHETDPASGSDKNPHTQRFVGLPASLTPEDEAARVAAWWAHEKAGGFAPQRPAEKDTGIIVSSPFDPHAETKAIIRKTLF